MQYERICYQTKSGMEIDYFLIDLGETLGWRAYVLTDINFKSVSRERSDTFEDTHVSLEFRRHRFIDPDRDYPYICWTKPIFHLESLLELVKMWSEITDVYIREGGDYETIQAQLEESGVL